MTEIELAKEFIAYFDKYEIYQEVPAYGIIDFVAKQGAITIAVEVKKSLNFDVIKQADGNKNYCTYSYVAVQRPKKQHFGYQICRDYGIGIIAYQEISFGEFDSQYIEEIVKPKMNRKAPAHLLNLKDYMKKSVAGSKNDRMTAFKNSIDSMVKYIKRHDGCTLNECLNSFEFHWGNMTSAKSSIYQWIRQGIITEFYLENSKLHIRELKR